MRTSFLLSVILWVMIVWNTQAAIPVVSNEPDSAYLFAYASQENGGRNGLHFAWSIDRENWHPIGPEHSYVRCDYGRWGTQKRMVSPYLYKENNGSWHCVWSVNETDGAFAHAASPDLVKWKRQSYPAVMEGGNCLEVEISRVSARNEYAISWESVSGTYYVTTSDFKTYSERLPASASLRTQGREQVSITGQPETGTVHKVDWKTIDGLMQAWQIAGYKQALWAEDMSGDPVRFASLQPVDVQVALDPSREKQISNELLGVFFEDISHAADGGLYAELIQNRDFEYDPADREYNDPEWNHRKAWELKGNAVFEIDTVVPIHPNNKHYALLKVGNDKVAFVNEGFDGIPLKAGEKYDFSLFARMQDAKNGKLRVRLVDTQGKAVAETTIGVPSSKWEKRQAVLTVNETVADARLEIIPQTPGTYALDMVSLFPQKTFKNRKNGLRADLAQVIADMNPRFVRFPGGCVAHGDGLDNMYRWKNTIGPLEARTPQRNIWGYHQTAGLGYFEYFLFCEDIGAEPVPILPAGVCCQNSATGGAGQQGGVPMCEMHDYVQEVLDLIEYANGNIKTTWGKKRAEAGHPKPFHLKYIGIGNEDLITDVFEERFTLLFNAVKEKHPEITVIGTVGPFCEGTDYEEGWAIADKLDIPVVDEHYYQTPGWFIHNQDFYDRYDRSKSKVYLGEYAAHLPGRPNNVETALTEALFLTSVERNGDIVSMTSYAPLFAKEGHINWNPDLIYFTNTEVKPTVGYYVQQLYGLNSGDIYIPHTISCSDSRESVRKRIALSVVRDSQSNDLIIKLVNLLPVTVRVNMDLKKLGASGQEVARTLLTGAPGDKSAKPVTDAYRIGDEFAPELPAYSFSVYRVHSK